MFTTNVNGITTTEVIKMLQTTNNMQAEIVEQTTKLIKIQIFGYRMRELREIGSKPSRKLYYCTL